MVAIPRVITRPIEFKAVIELNTSTPNAANVLKSEYLIANIVLEGLSVLLM